MHVYLHVPFCARRCSYCDFAIAIRRQVPSAEYVASIAAELRAVGEAEWIAEAGPVETIYFGGGTPSQLGADAIGELVALLAGRLPLAADAEVTLEANPEDVDPGRARGWVAAGVNRVSLGVQSFHPAVLRWMHRVHDADQAEVAVSVLREAGVANISLDLIYGVPEGLGRIWEADLSRALLLGPDHLSLYGLTVEPSTALGKWVDRGAVIPLADDGAAREYLDADAVFRSLGWHHYEVSSAARPGFESRHNQAYWARRSYLGLGPSAHSAHRDRRWWNVREWEAYRQRVAAQTALVDGEEILTPAQARLEEVYLGLRTSGGLPASSLLPSTVNQWVAAGWAGVSGSQVVLTGLGWLRLDGLVRRAELA